MPIYYDCPYLAWWTTSIVDMHPGVIRFRGYAIEDLIGRVGSAQMVWLMLRGELPTAAQAALLESAGRGGLAHAWEQEQQGGRIKGPMPPDFLYRYDGPPARPLEDAGGS